MTSEATSFTDEEELFLAILSLDSYNRGYNSGIIDAEANLGTDSSDLSDGTVKIGNASVSYNLGDAGLADVSETFNFYAVAYELNGKTIISYRGTDDFRVFSPNSDIWTGWRFGTGSVGGTQLDLAPGSKPSARG